MNWALFWEWIIKSLVLVFTLLIGFGYLTYYERRFLALLQSRLGPRGNDVTNLIATTAGALAGFAA